MTRDACGSTDQESCPTLIIPERSHTLISDSQFAELCAEFGSSSPPSTSDAQQKEPLEVDVWKRAPRDTAWDTCPFCGSPMQNPSSKLQAMIHYWLLRQRQGQDLRPTDTLAVCQRHRDEKDVIPQGLAQGWPAKIDFRNLRRRISDPSQRYLRVLEEHVLTPERSVWFQHVKLRRESIGKKASSGVVQIDTFHERQPG